MTLLVAPLPVDMQDEGVRLPADGRRVRLEEEASDELDEELAIDALTDLLNKDETERFVMLWTVVGLCQHQWSVKVVLAWWKVKTPCHANGVFINKW